MMMTGGVRVIFQEKNLLSMLTFLHELLCEEGESTRYSVSSVEAYGEEDFDAKTPAAEVHKGSDWFGDFSLPDLKSGNVVSADASTGLELRAEDHGWIRAQLERWSRITGESPPRVLFRSKKRIAKLAPLSYTAVFRCLAWLFGSAQEPDPSACLKAVWSDGSATSTFSHSFPAPTLHTCPDCRTEQPRWIHQALLRALKVVPSALARLELDYRATPTQSFIIRPSKGELSVALPALDQLETVFALWDEVVASPWDVDPAALPAPAAVRVEAGAARIPLRGYEGASYRLVFKALAWLHGQAPGSEIALWHRDPQGGFAQNMVDGQPVLQKVERPLLRATLPSASGEAVDLGGLALPRDLLEAAVQAIDLGRVVRIGAGDEPALGVDIAAGEATAQGADSARLEAALTAWQALEARPLG